MTTRFDNYNYLALLQYLNADRIVEVRLVKGTYLVRFERKLAKFALFVKKSIVEQILSEKVIESFCYYIDSKIAGTNLTFDYNWFSKKFMIGNRRTQECYSVLTLRELSQINLTLTLDGLAIVAKPKPRQEIKISPYFLTGTSLHAKTAF